MAGEIVGSASVRIEPDTSGFDAALITNLQAALEQANALIIASFKDASEQATASLASIGTDGVDAVTAATATAADDITSTFATAAGTAAADLSTVGDGLAASVAAGASEAATEIEGIAANVPDIAVAVTADTATAEADIANVVALADAEIATVTVEADTTGAEASISDLSNTASDASANVDGLAGGLERVTGAGESAAGAAGALGGAISRINPEAAAGVAAVGALGAATKGFFDDALKADSATRFLTKTTGEFKGAVESVNVGTLNGNLQDLAQQVGTNIPLLETAAGKVFQLGTSSGVTGPKVAQTTDQIIALALNARNIRPSLGEAGDIVDSLGRGLARGGRFLAAYGISLTAAQINQEAFNETGKTSATQLTQFEKEAAGAKLASDQLGGSFKTNLSDALDNPVIKLAVLRNNFELLKEKIGAPLIQPVTTALQEFEPVAESAATLVGGIALALVPLLTVAGAVLQPIAALISAGGALSPVLFGIATAAGIATLALNTLELTPVGVLIGLAAAAIVAVGSVIHAFTGGDDGAKKFAASVEQTTAALTDQNGKLVITTQSVDKYIQSLSGFDKGEFGAAIGKLGLNVDTTSAQLLAGKAGADQFKQSIDALTVGAGLLGDKFKDQVIGQFKDLQAQLEASAAATLTSAEADGAITKAQLDAALSSGDVLIALQRLQPQLDAHQNAVDAATAAYGPLISQVTLAAGNLTALDIESTAAHDAVIALTTAGVNPTSSAFVQFAITIDKAKLSAKGMAEVAGSLGISVDSLKGFITGVTGALNSFVSKSVSGLPTVADAFKPVTTSAGSAGGAMANTAQQALQAQRAIESAQHGVETANRGVVDSADALVKANEGVQTSVDGLTQAQKNLKDAEQALIDARSAASPKDVEQANINLERAQLNVAKASDAVTKAETELDTARSGQGTISIHDAEQNLEDARLSQRESVIRVSDAEDALTKVRQIGTEADKNVTTAEKAVATAHDQVTTAAAATVTAQHQVELANRGVADAAFAARQAQEALQSALEKPSSSGGSAAAKQGTVSLQDFIKNLQASTIKTQKFIDDIDVIFKAGGEQLSGEIAQLGVANGFTYAEQLAKSIGTNGKSALVTSAEQAVEAHNKELEKATTFLTDTFGPKYIATTGLITDLASKAFDGNLTFAEKTRLAANLAASDLDDQGKAIAIIAANKGKDAADEYGRLFKIPQKTIDAGEAAATTLTNTDLSGPAGIAAGTGVAGYGGVLGDPTTGLPGATSDALAAAAADFERGGLGIVRAGSLSAGAGGLQGFVEGIHPIPDAAGSAVSDAGPAMTKSAGLVADLQATAAGASIGQAFAIGVALGMSPVRGSIAQTSIDSASAGLVAYAKQQVKFYAQSSSPSKVFAEIGTFLTLGLASGIEDASALSKVGDAAKKAIQAADTATRQAISQTDFPSGLPGGTPQATLGSTATGQTQITVAAGAIQMLFTGALPTDAQAQNLSQQVEAGVIRAMADRDAQVNNRVLAR